MGKARGQTALLESIIMNETEDSASVAQAWLAALLAPATAAVRRGSIVPAALAALAAEALARRRSLLLVTADDSSLPEISNALDLNLRPLCLVLPAADYACRIALRATLSLLRSRLARAGDDAEGPAWTVQRRQLAAHADLWRDCLAWSGRDLDEEAWPPGLERLFPVRILPIALARRLSVASDWVVLVDARQLPEECHGNWPGAQRILALYPPAPGLAGALVRADPASRQQAELEVLTQELSELELELATAQAEIADFTRRYHTLVGTRMSRLDALRAELAELRAAARPEDADAVRAAARPEDADAVRAAADAQTRAEQSQRESRRFADLDRNEAPPFAPSGDIKRLYRKLAQQIHPDRARDENDRAWRTQLMSEANRAYRAGDELALREVLALWQEGAWRDALAKTADDTQAKQLARLRQRIADIERELNRLFGSKLYELFTATNIARRAGRDLLQEMADRLDADIAAVQRQLAEETAPS
jgi:hypothetical protein